MKSRYLLIMTVVRRRRWMLLSFFGILAAVILFFVYVHRDIMQQRLLQKLGTTFTTTGITAADEPEENEALFNNKNSSSTVTSLPKALEVLDATFIKIKIENLDSFVLPPSPNEVPSIQWKKSKTDKRVYPSNSVEHDKSCTDYTSTEGFTIVMLTHAERMLVLPKKLEHLSGLEGLKKVIIIWNGKNVLKEMSLPETPFPVHILCNGKNSLNHRFLPLNIIETEAVLSQDDDVFASHESILFAFRVWREYRDQIVGFPGRGVKWTLKGWEYNSRPSACTISMVLTGFAFLHRKYLNLYTYEMPAAIRERVFNITNCEDIAMNFLVSHVTQRAPVRVLNLEQYGCKDCEETDIQKKSLWMNPKHFENRNACVNFFSKVYGYTPLFKAEYRHDLFEGKSRCGHSNIENHSATEIHHSYSMVLAGAFFFVLASIYPCVFIWRRLLPIVCT